MSKNRGDRILLLQKVVSKHFTPIPAPDDRTLLEHLIYACCLEDARYDAADEAFHRLHGSFFDWNEVRVTTVTELCETLHNLPNPSAAAIRVKKNLQSIFETRYSYDLDDLIKMNQGKAIQELEKLSGITRFVLNYTIQNALGGHAIPISNSIMNIFLATEIVSENEAKSGQVPGLERTISKSKGQQFTSCLHQLAVEAHLKPSNKAVRSILKDAGAPEPKKPTAKPTPTPKAAEKTGARAKTTKKAAKTKSATASKSIPVKKSSKKKTSPPKSKPAKKAPVKKTTKRKPR
ncbi:MAG: hypothetical protein KDB03_04355 [Planctomycetales bacterium]|nr:hypothetical protein [Planctomycetales bacterium]